MGRLSPDTAQALGLVFGVPKAMGRFGEENAMTGDNAKVVSFPARPWPAERDGRDANRRMHLHGELAGEIKGSDQPHKTR